MDLFEKRNREVRNLEKTALEVIKELGAKATSEKVNGPIAFDLNVSQLSTELGMTYPANNNCSLRIDPRDKIIYAKSKDLLPLAETIRDKYADGYQVKRE